jgi:Thiamine pyrophosphate enzyme, N-terminal TPP binding domain/Thiamine pyrophosphate enzyme, central domain
MIATGPKSSNELESSNIEKSAVTDGFHLVVDALKLNGIDTIYGVAGIPITDLARLAQAEGMRYIGFRHEQSAGNAAAISGYLTQKPGICLTVSAPGFLNGLVAVANATSNGFPMIQISGSSDREIIDLQQGDYEELDQLNAAKPYTKAAFRVNKPEDIGIGIARAIRAAVSGRPGGVYLDLTAEVLGAALDADAGVESLVRVVDPVPRQIPAPDSIERALGLLASAQRPLIILGKGAAYAQADADIRSFIEKTGIPYLPMSMAKGLLPDNHPQSAAAARSLVLAQADVVMLIGARLNWLLAHGKAPRWSPTTRFVQVDISPTEIDSNRPIAAPVVADIRSTASSLSTSANSNSPEPTKSALSPLLVESFTWFAFRPARNCLPFSSPHNANRAAICAVVVPNNGLAITAFPFALPLRGGADRAHRARDGGQGAIRREAPNRHLILAEVEIASAIDRHAPRIVGGREGGDDAAGVDLANARGFGNVEIAGRVARQGRGGAELAVVGGSVIAGVSGIVQAGEAGESGWKKRLRVGGRGQKKRQNYECASMHEGSPRLDAWDGQTFDLPWVPIVPPRSPS